MKKILILGILTLSALSFGADTTATTAPTNSTSTNTATTMPMMNGGMMMCPMMKNGTMNHQGMMMNNGMMHHQGMMMNNGAATQNSTVVPAKQ